MLIRLSLVLKTNLSWLPLLFSMENNKIHVGNRFDKSHILANGKMFSNTCPIAINANKSIINMVAGSHIFRSMIAASCIKTYGTILFLDLENIGLIYFFDFKIASHMPEYFRCLNVSILGQCCLGNRFDFGTSNS